MMNPWCIVFDSIGFEFAKTCLVCFTISFITKQDVSGKAIVKVRRDVLRSNRTQSGKTYSRDGLCYWSTAADASISGQSLSSDCTDKRGWLLLLKKAHQLIMLSRCCLDKLSLMY